MLHAATLCIHVLDVFIFFPFDSYNTNYDLEKIEEYEWEFIIFLQNYF